MKGGLRRHLRRTYAAIITIALVSIVVLSGFIACIWQFNDLLRKTDASVAVYAKRVEREGTITSRAQIERIIAGTSHPGCVLRIALARTRYLVTWDPLTIKVVPRNTSVDGAPSMRLVDRLGGVPSLLGGHVIVNSYELALVPIGPVQTILIRTFVASALAALIVVVFALLISRRMARDALKPLRALYQALKDAAAGHHPAAVPQMGRDEIGELIATYNAAIEAERKAQLARDAAEARTHQFIADAGHQLRTPLTVLSGFIGILRSGRLRSADDQPQILKKMEQQVMTISTLVDRLMLLDSWQSTDRPNFELVDIGELVTAIVDPIASTHPDRAFHLDVDQGASAAVDREELTYAVSNILRTL